jgi:hypothetical protein
MLSYNATIGSKHSPETVFDYLANFANAAEWDPGIVEANLVTPEPIQFGSRFELVSTIAGRRVKLTYQLLTFDRPNVFVVRAEGSGFVSEDTISFKPEGEGTIVHYNANLILLGVGRVFTPVWKIVFNRIGSRAAKSLAKWLNREAL